MNEVCYIGEKIYDHIVLVAKDSLKFKKRRVIVLTKPEKQNKGEVSAYINIFLPRNNLIQ